ncbi:hypothetical protein F4779DRAFT_567503 [Xylariaceae sp. FL0662B]|nr:hypothetical protein F4779DRAFT_567503 [Xylariaceae sp. FL0662B]
MILVEIFDEFDDLDVEAPVVAKKLDDIVHQLVIFLHEWTWAITDSICMLFVLIEYDVLNEHMDPEHDRVFAGSGSAKHTIDALIAQIYKNPGLFDEMESTSQYISEVFDYFDPIPFAGADELDPNGYEHHELLLDRLGDDWTLIVNRNTVYCPDAAPLRDRISAGSLKYIEEVPVNSILACFARTQSLGLFGAVGRRVARLVVHAFIAVTARFFAVTLVDTQSHLFPTGASTDLMLDINQLPTITPGRPYRMRVRVDIRGAGGPGKGDF